MKINSLPTYKIILIIVIIITGLIYVKTSSFGFVNWDDDENIRTNVRYKDLNYDNMKFHYQNARYKALAIWSFMGDNALFGKKVGWYHLHNVLLHLINILLVFLLTLRLIKKETIALFTAALFALHPVFIEPVAWVTGRKDLLFVLYLLLAGLAYIKYLEKQQNVIWLLIVAVFIYLSSLAKIQAFTIPLMLLGFDWFFKRKISFMMIFEKIMLFALIANLTYIFIILFIINVLVFIRKKLLLDFISKRKEKAVNILYWYLPITAILIVFTTFLFSSLTYVLSSFPLGENCFKTPLGNSILILLTLFIIIFFINIRKRKKIIEKLISAKDIWIIILFLSPILIILIKNISSWVTGYITNNSMSYQVLNFWNTHSENINYYSITERLILTPLTLLFYLSRFLLISQQNPMIAYPEHNTDGGLPGNMFTTAIVCYILFALIIFILIKYFRKNKIVMLGIIWFLTSISVVMHLIPIEGRVLAADRYAYPAYIGLFLIIGYGTDFLLQKFRRTYVYTVMIIIMIILSIITYVDLDTWKSSKILWQKALKVTPENHYAMYSLSLAYFVDEKNPEKALQYLDNAIKLKENFQYYNNRGHKYALNDLSGALADINKSILLDSNSYAAYNNRGALHQKFGNFKNALNDFNKAIKLKPNFYEAINNRTKVMQLIILDSTVNKNLYIPPERKNEVVDFILKTSQIYINNKDFSKASDYLSKGIAIDPSILDLHEMLAVMYQLNKDYDKAMKAYNQGLLYIPANPTLMFGRGLLYFDLGDTVKACEDASYAASQGNTDAEKFRQQICGK